MLQIILSRVYARHRQPHHGLIFDDVSCLLFATSSCRGIVLARYSAVSRARIACRQLGYKLRSSVRDARSNLARIPRRGGRMSRDSSTRRTRIATVDPIFIAAQLIQRISNYELGGWCFGSANTQTESYIPAWSIRFVLDMLRAEISTALWSKWKACKNDPLIKR